VIDDAHDGRAVQQHYSGALFAAYKVPPAQRGDRVYLGNAITIDPLNDEARAYPRAMQRSENQYPGSDRCSVCAYVASIADGLGSVEAYGFIRTSITKLGLRPCSAYHGAADLEFYSELYKKLVRQGVVSMQEIYQGQDENVITRVLPMLTHDGVAKWNGTGLTLVNGVLSTRIIVRLPNVYAEQETLGSWVTQYGGCRWDRKDIDFLNAEPPVSWIASMDNANVSIQYCPPSLVPMVMNAVLNSQKSGPEKMMLGLKVLEVSKDSRSPLASFLADKDVFHRGVFPADYPCAPGPQPAQVFLTLKPGRPNYLPKYIITRGKLSYPDYLWRLDKIDHMGLAWHVYEYYNTEEGFLYKTCCYVASDNTCYAFVEGDGYYNLSRDRPPMASYWSLPGVRIMSFKTMLMFETWVKAWGKKLSLFALVPRMIFDAYMADNPDYYEVGESSAVWDPEPSKVL